MVENFFNNSIEFRNGKQIFFLTIPNFKLHLKLNVNETKLNIDL